MRIKICKLSLITLCVLLIACDTQKNEAKSPFSIAARVDQAVIKLEKQIIPYQKIVTINHAKLAKEAGVYTPPSTVTIFSNSKINAPLLGVNQLVGLDLPFKVLCFTEPDTADVNIAFTSADFIAKRHEMDRALFTDFEKQLSSVLAAFPDDAVSTTEISKISPGFGITTIQSDYDFQQTIENLKKVVMSQGDTKWFADIDFQKDAAENNIQIPPTYLLLFGGPAPGGKAMETSPKLGLDAFCQKVLVYQNPDGKVAIAYNDIVAFAKLYYGRSTPPQEMINGRLKATFEKAVVSQTP